MTDHIEGYLQVGTNDRGEVVLNLDKDRTGHIVFSPKQAANLADVLLKKASEASPLFSDRAFRISEEARQAIVLGLAMVKNDRPGWSHFIETIAEIFSATEMMNSFADMNRPTGLLLLEWECHVCHRRRPDASISVHQRDISAELEVPLPQGAVVENVRYCNDSPSCEKAAQTLRLFTTRSKS